MNKQLTQERNFDEVEFISGYVMRLIKLTEQNIKLGKETNDKEKNNKEKTTQHFKRFENRSSCR
jgi:hypothetical protein|tara:strand:+ start:682 stop:873 length:192 start_codon:yes stop_codon:yes gene_type:complete